MHRTTYWTRFAKEDNADDVRMSGIDNKDVSEGDITVGLKKVSNESLDVYTVEGTPKKHFRDPQLDIGSNSTCKHFKRGCMYMQKYHIYFWLEITLKTKTPYRI